MLKSLFLLTGAVFLLQQGVGVNDQGINRPGASGDSGVDGATVPNFTGSINLRPEAGAYDEPPVWIREPTRARVGAVFPARAIRTGQDGHAEMTCRLTVDGALTGCVVTNEGPAGFGFGQAALALTPDLNIRPAQRAGRPVASTVGFRVSFTGPGDRTIASRTGVDTMSAQRFLPRVAWLAAPTYDQLLAAYPAAARAAGKGGRVTLDCVLGDDGALRTCDISNEEPVGLGFGDAARRLAPSFRAQATTPDGASVAGAGVVIPVTFSNRMLQPGARPTGRPSLAVMPTNEDFGRAFPVQARRAAVLSGDATIDCAIADNGALSGCSVARETPQGMGFGDAALSLAPKFQVNPWSSEGLPVAGGRIRVPVKYQLKAGT